MQRLKQETTCHQAAQRFPALDLAVGNYFSMAPNQGGSRGPEGVTFSSPDFPLDCLGCIGVYLQVA